MRIAVTLQIRQSRIATPPNWGARLDFDTVVVARHGTESWPIVQNDDPGTAPGVTRARAVRRAGYGGPVSLDVRAHITGTVWKVEVSVGDPVQEGDVVVILESMKMEMPVESPGAGRVSRVEVQEGAAVEEGDLLVVLD